MKNHVSYYLRDAHKCLQRDIKKGMTTEIIKAKYAEVFTVLDEIERIANDGNGRAGLRRIK
jgi:hypothetical protein